MSTLTRPRTAFAIATPALIFITCTSITFSARFKQYPDDLALAIVIDMLFTAPFLYYILISKTAIPKTSVLRVFILGAFLTNIILSESNSTPIIIIRTYVFPIAEILLVSYIVYTFYTAKKRYKKTEQNTFDFLIQARVVLTSVLGSKKIAHVLAAEIAVFYYIFSKRKGSIEGTTTFTCYKENGARLILWTLLALLVIETVGVHFILQLWSETAAWILTGLSMYSCLQLFAHIRSLKTRPVVLTDDALHVRNGILGGEVDLKLDNIAKVVRTSKSLSEPGVVKLAVIKELETHNLAIYLKEPVPVFRAFGFKRTGQILLINIDKPNDFINTITEYNNA